MSDDDGVQTYQGPPGPAQMASIRRTLDGFNAAAMRDGHPEYRLVWDELPLGVQVFTHGALGLIWEMRRGR